MKPLSKRQARAKLEELQMYLGMARYRGAAIFPGPGWEEDVARLEREIKDLKKKYEI